MHETVFTKVRDICNLLGFLLKRKRLLPVKRCFQKDRDIFDETARVHAAGAVVNASNIILCIQEDKIFSMQEAGRPGLCIRKVTAPGRVIDYPLVTAGRTPFFGRNALFSGVGRQHPRRADVGHDRVGEQQNPAIWKNGLHKQLISGLSFVVLGNQVSRFCG